MREHPHRKLAAILFADIVGYTAMMQTDEPAALSALQKFKTALESKVTEHQGQIIQFYGDGCLATFESSVNAVDCAQALQLDFQATPKVPVRIGLHAGDVVYREGNVFGDAVNIASRVESMGVPGSVLLSSNVRNQIKNKPHFELVNLGKFEFKNVEEGMTVYALRGDKLTIPKTNEIKGKLKEQPKFRMAKGLWMSLILLATIVAGVLFNKFMLSDQKTEIAHQNSAKEKTIAVLPLANLNPKEENLDYFSVGVSQEIISELAQISPLKVAAFTQSSYYGRQNLEPKEVAERLGVQYLISGTVRLFENGQKVKLSLELFDPTDNEINWQITFDESIDKASTIQNTIAKQVAKNLNLNLSQKDISLINQVETTDGKAFKLYLRAKAEINKLTAEGFTNTQSFLREAIKLDPNFSNAYILFAWSYVMSMNPWNAPDIPSSLEINKQAFPLIEKAIALNPTNSDGYLVRGGLRLFLDNNVRGAKQDIDHALALNSWPRIPTDYCICTAVSNYVAIKDTKRAKEIADLATTIDPENILLE
ncbi:MAG: adenylate/guanylate cyclase domain-containing protein [Bacteroidota bacterium]